MTKGCLKILAVFVIASPAESGKIDLVKGMGMPHTFRVLAMARGEV
jgi:hypothetical protein